MQQEVLKTNMADMIVPLMLKALRIETPIGRFSS